MFLKDPPPNQPFLPCPHLDKHIYSSESKSSFLQSRGEASKPLKPPPKHLGLIFLGMCLLWFRVPLMNLLFLDCCQSVNFNIFLIPKKFNMLEELLISANLWDAFSLMRHSFSENSTQKWS